MIEPILKLGGFYAWENHFWMRRKWSEVIEAWVHEFTEMTVDAYLVNEGIDCRDISFNSTTYCTLPHLVTSLHYISGWEGKLIYPSQFIKIIVEVIL